LNDRYAVKTDLSKIPFQKETPLFTQQLIEEQKKALMQNAL